LQTPVYDGVHAAGMKFIKHLLVTLALGAVALFGALAIAEVYRRLKYPHVTRHEADVFFDIGLVFFLGFVVLAGTLGGSWLLLRKRRALQEHHIHDNAT
jgi:hypothetical protein